MPPNINNEELSTSDVTPSGQSSLEASGDELRFMHYDSEVSLRRNKEIEDLRQQHQQFERERQALTSLMKAERALAKV